MANRRINSYWLILLAVLMTVNMVLSVEQTQAHYVNTTVWNTVLEADGKAVASNCLASVSGAPITVLLGHMDTEMQKVSFTLASSKDTSGNLTWSVDKGDYLNVSMHADEAALTSGGAVELVSGTTKMIIMKLALTEAALTTVHEEMDIHVTVNWGESLQGTFRVTIPAVTEDELPTEPTETTAPTETTEPAETTTPTEATDPAPTEGEETIVEAPEEDPAEATDPVTPAQEDAGDAGDTGESGEEPTENAQTAQYNMISLLSDFEQNQDENAVDAGEPVESSETNPPTTDPPATNPPATEPPATEPPATEPPATNPPATDPPATEPPATEPTEGGGKQEIRMGTIGAFAPEQKLPVSLTLTEGITKVRLGTGTVSEEETVLQSFPAFTCYSLDNGAGYYLMYYADVLEIEPKGSTQVSVLLDFSRIDLAENADIALVAEGYAGQSLVSSTSAGAKTGVGELYRMDSRFLTRNSALQIALTDRWKDCTFDYSVEILSASAASGTNGAETEYLEVDASAWSNFATNEDSCMLTFQIGETLPAAGTYRLNMNWNYEGICFAQTQTTFFINYSVYSKSERTGGIEQ